MSSDFHILGKIVGNLNTSIPEYTGSGHYANHDDRKYAPYLPLTQCVQWCADWRQEEGEEWNVVRHSPADNLCICYKNARGDWGENSKYRSYRLVTTTAATTTTTTSTPEITTTVAKTTTTASPATGRID